MFDFETIPQFEVETVLQSETLDVETVLKCETPVVETALTIESKLNQIERRPGRQ